ncbi:DegT/DnrJ/EryC1/StrS family aminotransferase [Candidatus Pelagibacter communis]|uniref:DegT/DnrJ/EryC1/StrS family aminotransferase n=1 Tax=Candidatus Pelagibacter TaxID=198251 RepID=UPI003EE15A47
MKNKILKLLEKKNIENKIFNYPLHDDALSKEDLAEGFKVLVSRQLTMSKKTKEFEDYFRKKLKLKYCLMVNSGSSANLLSLFALTNPKKKNRLKIGDECLVPSVCWSTSLWPVIQAGLKPKLIDVDLNSFSLSLEIIKKNFTKKTKAIILINVLGNTSDIDEIRRFATKKKVYLIEDNCESLGSKYRNKYLGSFGDFSSFSFYYSHQITSGEGGMVACKNKSDYLLLKTLRAHGWDRDISKHKQTKNFNFINSGFNLRPLEISAAIGLSQFKRLKKMMAVRAFNRDMLINSIKKSVNWNNQFNFFYPFKNVKPSWFGFPILLNPKLIKKKEKFMSFLNKNNVETRPIISGNFVNQPAIKLYNINFNKKKLINANQIDKRGFFIGLPTIKLSNKKIKILTELLLRISHI